MVVGLTFRWTCAFVMGRRGGKGYQCLLPMLEATVVIFDPDSSLVSTTT
jgi:hypothetical protein